MHIYECLLNEFYALALIALDLLCVFYLGLSLSNNNNKQLHNKYNAVLSNSNKQRKRKQQQQPLTRQQAADSRQAVRQ